MIRKAAKRPMPPGPALKAGRRPTAALLALFLAVAWALPAVAADFTITVPLRLHKLVEGVAKAKVFCEVLSSRGERIGAREEWSASFADASGDIVEDLVIAFDASEGRNPHLATRYRCELKLNVGGSGSQAWQTPSPTSTQYALRAKPGTEFRAEVSGPVPKGQTEPPAPPPQVYPARKPR